jgi:hypothetical protein
MERRDIKVLLELYFEGQTTLQQEDELSDYFLTCEDIPAEWLPYRAIFTAFAAAKEVTTTVEPNVQKPRHSWRVIWGAVASLSAAACLALGIFLWSAETQRGTTDLVCYVDGEQITDNDMARAEAERILASAAAEVNQAMAQIEKINIFNKR